MSAAKRDGTKKKNSEGNMDGVVVKQHSQYHSPSKHEE
jgi:hypothetical protein